MLQIAKFVAVLSCGLFTGAALYISLVEHPARMECGTDIAVTVFGPSYRRATAVQVTLASLGLLSSITAWLAGEKPWWLIGGLLLGSVMPFTLVVIFPTNKRLLSPTLNHGSPQARELLSRWAVLHAVRTAISFLALTIFLFLTFFENAVRR